jgi:SPP1 gp7 family putative phage head morphogenesis protein
LIKHQIFLERFAGTIAQTIQNGLDRARDAAVNEIITGVDGVNTRQLQTYLATLIARRLEDALEELKELAQYEAEFNVNVLKKELDEVAEATQAAILAAMLNKPMPIGLVDKKANRKIEPAYNKFAEQSARQLTNPIREAQILGSDNLTAAATIIALTAGLLAAQSKSLARSSVVHTANTSKEEVFKANPIKQVEWVSVLDSSTTDYCRGQDGKLYDVGSGPRPPAHYNCRSITRPVI